MKGKFRVGPSWLCVLGVAAAFVGCSGATPDNSGQPAAGGSSAGVAGSASGPAGAPSAGAAGSTAHAGGAGVPSGGAAGMPATAGSSSGGPAGGSGSGGSSGSGTGGGGGTSNGGTGGGSGGGSGTGGGASGPAAELDGFGWTMKCNKADTSAGAENRCYLLPAGQDVCPAAGYTSIDQTLHFGGTAGTTYMVALHFQGSQEAGDYSGGTAVVKEFLKDATRNDGLHNFLSMEVSSPHAMYFPNAGAGGGTVTPYDYKVTVKIDGGATIHMKAFDKDCLQHRFCPDTTYKNCGQVLPPFSPASAPIDGDFLFVTVDSVTPM